MSRLNEVSTHRTNVLNENGVVSVIYYSTKVIEIDTNNRTVKLNSGGYKTKTTKLRMNQAINQYIGIYCPISVYQKNYNWYVNMDNENVLEFQDGMVIDY